MMGEIIFFIVMSVAFDSIVAGAFMTTFAMICIGE